MNARRISVLAIAALLAVCSFVAAGVKAQSGAAQHGGPGTPAEAGGKKAEEQFKNIKVLKGVPAEQIFPTMQFITASLGVECDFCHVQGAFEKDDKKNKQTARRMMEMMFAINADHFDGERKVTCNTCHRGAAAPQPTPAVMTEMAMAEPKKPEEVDAKDAGPTPDQLLDKYLQAAGGASAIDKVTTRIMKGTIDFGGRSMPIDIYAKDPDMRISFTHMSDGDSVTAFNGHEGWLAMPNGQQREMRGSDLDGASIDADMHLATHLKSMFSDMIPHGTEKVGDRDAVVILGRRDGKPPIRLSFDKETGLLLRLVRYGETALGLMPTQIDYADYRDTNGVKVPYQWTLARPSGRFTIKVSDMKQNVPVDDAKFVRPPAPPEPPKGPAK